MRFIRGFVVAAALVAAAVSNSAAGSCSDWEKSNYLHPGLGVSCFLEWLMDFTDP